MAEKFSFFPNPREKSMIGIAVPEQIVMLIERQPNMTGRFIHELFRQNKQSDCYQALQRINLDLFMVNTIYDDLAVSSAMMRSMFRVPVDEINSFISAAVDIVIRAKHSIPLDTSLDSETQTTANDVVRAIIDEAADITRRYTSR